MKLEDIYEAARLDTRLKGLKKALQHMPAGPDVDLHYDGVKEGGGHAPLTLDHDLLREALQRDALQRDAVQVWTALRELGADVEELDDFMKPDECENGGVVKVAGLTMHERLGEQKGRVT